MRTITLKSILPNLLAASWLFYLCSVQGQTITFYDMDEEFAGPFPSWKNVRTDFVAKGDGEANDSAALQRALDAMKDMPRLNWSVLYVPAGTYRLTAPLTTKRDHHADYLGFSIIGEDPANTILLWDGPAGQNMINLDAWYCKLSRLTFDGKGAAKVGLMRDGGFSTYCELSDLIFRDMTTGVSFGAGRGDAGQAEHAVLRCHFLRCARAGVLTANFNSLDIYVWHCLFEDCGNAIYNVAGGYHAYENVFLRSKERDLRADNLCTFAWVNNVSVGSKCFFDMAGHTWPSPILVQGNRIYDFTGPFAMRTGNAGSQVLLDNHVRSSGEDNSREPVHLAAGDQLLLGNSFLLLTNRFGVRHPINTFAADTRKGRYRILDNIVGYVPPFTPSQTGPITLPGTPKKKDRLIFEVSPRTGDDAAEIQAKIDAAAAQTQGSRPVVHIPRGAFSISKTLVIPPGKEIQIIGDGGGENGTSLNWAGQGSQPLLRLPGPRNHATIRDLSIHASNGVLIENADQSGGRIYANQLNLSGAGDKFCEFGILVDGVEQTDILSICGGVSSFLHGVQAKGGKINVLSGASSRGTRLFDVTDGGRMIAQGYWYEADWKYPSPFVDLRGKSGTLTIAAMPWAVNTDASFYGTDGFSGTFAFLCNNVGQRIYRWNLAGDGSPSRILSLCNSFNMTTNDLRAEDVWNDQTSPPAQAAMLNCNYWGKKTAQVPNVWKNKLGAEPDDAFIRDCLKPLRDLRIERLTARPAEVTDLKIIRVTVNGSGGKLVEIRR